MTAGLIGRALGVLELMTEAPGGLGVQALADEREIPVATMHRLLAELAQLGYVRKLREGQKYVLTTKLISLGFRCLSANSVADFAQPTLDNLAALSRELVRLAVVDDGRLTWVARAQGAGSGLRYDPDMGMDAKLFCTASGHAWLATLPEAEALNIVARQGFGNLADYGPNAPADSSALLACLKEVRSRGYARVIDSGAVGTAALAVAIVRPADQVVVGTVSIAGPSARLDEQRMATLAPELRRAAEEMSETCQFIDYFRK
jgi:IclR family transcriptional regulator, acetate operon repressor